MEKNLVILPEEVKELTLKVSEEKKKEVIQVLNIVFSGTSKWKTQVEAIEIEDINDLMSIQLAETVRKNVKKARLDSEKIFDAKRTEVQAKMQGFKTEDELWLKAKQTMQILFKDIEETAKYKADFVKRHEAEQRQLRNQIRYNKLLTFIQDEEISMLEVDSMSDESFNFYLSGIEKKYNEKIEAEKKAYEDEQKRIEDERKAEEERQRKLTLHNERKNSILDLWQFVPERMKTIDFSDDSLDWEDFVKELKLAKENHEAEQEAIRKENERLQKEAEREKKLYEIRSNKLNGLWATMPEKYANVSYIKMSDSEFATMLREATEAKLKKELADKKAKEEEDKKQAKAEAERKRIAEQEAKLKAEKEDAERKLKEANEAEEARLAKIEAEKQAELNKGDAEKVKDLIADLKSLKEKYTFKSQKNNKMYQDVKYLLDKIVVHINK